MSQQTSFKLNYTEWAIGAIIIIIFSLASWWTRLQLKQLSSGKSLDKINGLMIFIQLEED